nr:PREDICTED: uncharacterized protein LOC105669661 [Linepithema humile]
MVNICEEEAYTSIQHIADENLNELIPDEEEIHHSTIDVVSLINVTPPNSPRYNEPRYIGDIKTPHLATPRRAKRAFNLAKLVVKKQRRQILTLQQTTGRLKKRLKTIKDLIDHLKKKNFISDNAVDCLMVHFGQYS